jgi:hypothetical protein
LENRQVFCGFIIKVKWKRREREREEESLHSPVLRTSVACFAGTSGVQYSRYSLFILLRSQAQHYAIGSCLVMWKY